MNLHNTSILYHDFPHLYREAQEEDSRCALRLFGVECGDGWFDLVYDLSRKITEHMAAPPEAGDCRVLQVKQKFGALRFNVEGEDEAIRAMIDKAEERSQSICEVTGRPGQPCRRRMKNWTRTLCPEAAAELGYEPVQEDQ